MRIFTLIIFTISLLSYGIAEASDRKVVLITGASRGIGLAAAERLAKENYTVYATSRNIDGIHAPTKNLHFRTLDVTDPSTIATVVNEIIEKEGRIDVLTNNAGYALGGPLECLFMNEIQDEMNVNFFGVIRTCQEVLPHMRRQKSGHIINISSEQGVYGLPYGSLYTSSKAALESLSEALSIEVLPWNIFVSIVQPGFTATDFTVKLGSRTCKPYQKICDTIEKFLEEKRTVSETCQSPEEVAHFLQKVIEDPQPQLRYQTSKLAEEVVSKSITDLSGKEYSERMQSLVKDIYQDAWSAEE